MFFKNSVQNLKKKSSNIFFSYDNDKNISVNSIKKETIISNNENDISDISFIVHKEINNKIVNNTSNVLSNAEKESGNVSPLKLSLNGSPKGNESVIDNSITDTNKEASVLEAYYGIPLVNEPSPLRKKSKEVAAYDPYVNVTLPPTSNSTLTPPKKSSEKEQPFVESQQ